jgi:hypothetical protein
MVAGRMNKRCQVAADFPRCHGVLDDRGKAWRLADCAANLPACFVEGRPWLGWCKAGEHIMIARRRTDPRRLVIVLSYFDAPSIKCLVTVG